jgi:DNA adenine methylase
MSLKAPFPGVGGKSRAAPDIWSALGDVDNYVEPFAGSLATLLGRPDGDRGTETVNDLDGFIANFWRAVAHDPEATARAADWPVSEVDLSARHLWLVNNRAALTERLQVDPAYFDARIAGWWVWGLCSWIGSGWCSGEGPWSSDGERWVDARQLPHLGNAVLEDDVEIGSGSMIDRGKFGATRIGAGSKIDNL